LEFYLILDWFQDNKFYRLFISCRSSFLPYLFAEWS